MERNNFLAREIRFIHKTQTSLAEDMSFSMDTVAKIANEERRLGQFWARTEFRAFSAWIEGVTYAMKQSVLRAHEAGHIELSEAEKFLCAENSYALSNKGVPLDRQIFLRTAANMRFALTLFARLCSVDHQLDTESQGYEAFMKSITVRNRITHPKSVEDIELGVDETKVLQDAVLWYSNTVRQLFLKIQERAEIALEALRPPPLASPEAAKSDKE